jgi:hypothetical protein
MQLELTGEEAAALLRLLNRTIADDRYPLSPRIRVLRDTSQASGCSAWASAGEAANARGARTGSGTAAGTAALSRAPG